MQCPICNASINLIRKANDVEFRKEKFKVFETYYECDNCKEKIVDIEMGDSSLNQIYNQYREKYNLMFPSEIIELREKYESVQAGYHMNKKMWNTVAYTGEFPEKEFLQMIDHSYDEVVKGLTKKLQQELNSLE